jgi:hypothetical protein
MHVDPTTHLQLTRSAIDQAVRRTQHRHEMPPAANRRSQLLRRLGLVRLQLGTIRANRVTVAVPTARRRAGAEAL